ncbi:MAG: helix-turn-helix domain-containing protein [Candidatus Obscuribacterales bacterium]|nr:helix-turn-helix domain-containing protein [Candidatus Obscuribacterales bacterium]
MREVWRGESEDSEILFPCVSRLRKKLKSASSLCSIENSKSVGYRLLVRSATCAPLHLRGKKRSKRRSLRAS